jgi:large subunit ribosomal protein L10e
MRGAYGKPQGVTARVKIGQILLSVRTKDQFAPNTREALRRAKYKFPGRQQVVESTKWGFTQYPREQYQEWRANGLLQVDGNQVKYCPNRGPLKL